MKLKEFFLSLVRHGHEVEIYYDQEGFFGFKINGIDSQDLSEESVLNIGEEINNIFIDESNIHSLEGSTSYLLQKDGTCIKTASYFDHHSGFDDVWIADNYNTFNFGKISLPIDYIYIEKTAFNFEIDAETELKNCISQELFEEFCFFYEDLLIDFDEISVELTIDEDDESNIVSNISSIEGSDTTIIEKFTLMDCSKLDFDTEQLKSSLINGFKFNREKASLIVI